MPSLGLVAPLYVYAVCPDLRDDFQVLGAVNICCCLALLYFFRVFRAYLGVSV